MADKESRKSLEEIELAAAGFSQGAPVKVRPYVKSSSTGKQVQVGSGVRSAPAPRGGNKKNPVTNPGGAIRQGLSGARQANAANRIEAQALGSKNPVIVGGAGGLGRTPITPPTALPPGTPNPNPAVQAKALQAEAKAAAAGAAAQAKAAAAAKAVQVAQAKSAASIAKSQAAVKVAASKAQTAATKQQTAKQKQQAAAQAKANKAAKPKAPAKKSGSGLAKAATAFQGLRAASSLARLGRPPRVLGGRAGGKGRVLAALIRARRGKTASNKPQDSQSSKKKAGDVIRDVAAAKRALRAAELYRHGRGVGGKHSVPVDFHAKLALSAPECPFDYDVYELQHDLKDEGYTVELTGTVDEDTYLAIVDFLGISQEEPLI